MPASPPGGRGRYTQRVCWLFYAFLSLAGASAENGTGEGGIRTPGAGYFPHDGLANRCFKPLSHLSIASSTWRPIEPLSPVRDKSHRPDRFMSLLRNGAGGKGWRRQSGPIRRGFRCIGWRASVLAHRALLGPESGQNEPRLSGRGLIVRGKPVAGFSRPNRALGFSRGKADPQLFCFPAAGFSRLSSVNATHRELPKSRLEAGSRTRGRRRAVMKAPATPT